MRRLRRAQLRDAHRNRRFRRGAIAAGTAAAIAIASGASLAKDPPNIPPESHKIPVTGDADADLVSSREEYAIGYRPFAADQNRNGIRDGAELAMRCAAAIEQLLLEEDVTGPNETYKWHMAQRGLETCDVCGETVNMGPAGIVNPRLGIEVDCPMIALHYMEHGSFSYDGDLRQGRLEVTALLRALEIRYPCEPNEHQLPLAYVVNQVGQLAPDANDVDGDLLADSEELAIKTDLHDADQNNNLLPDGVEYARQIAEVIDALPEYTPQEDPGEELHKVGWFQHGLEYCEVCGESVNMGYWQIVNPRLRTSMDVYVITCHYMRHGSFSYHGNVFEGDPLHTGRADIARLAAILEMPRHCGDLGTLYAPGDTNEDCETNFADLAELVDRWLQSTEPGQD
ncbi:MAG: hypothetical protein JSU70_07455 [Phycisphaerales bacterium]|nr:MAG: hypothetical protein JSU70_07455 [Phycisphaerales bacterium]